MTATSKTPTHLYDHDNFSSLCGYAGRPQITINNICAGCLEIEQKRLLELQLTTIPRRTRHQMKLVETKTWVYVFECRNCWLVYHVDRFSLLALTLGKADIRGNMYLSDHPSIAPTPRKACDGSRPSALVAP